MSEPQMGPETLPAPTLVPALRVESLTAGYGDLMAVRKVSFEVAPGSLLTVLGRNGAGKTSTLLALTGFLRAREGRVVLLGEDVTAQPVQKRILAGLSLVQEGRRIFRKLTVAENLLIGTVPLRLTRSERNTRLQATYERFPLLAGKRDDTADRLSGGQQQVLAIAQALMASPKVLLLDEPSAGLAPAVLDSVMQTVRHLKDEGLAVVLVEQLVTRAMREADNVAILEGGRIVHYGPASDAAALQVAREVYLSERPQALA
jgi:branched-chain amino acid transport system ATP-binding protein